MKTDKELKALAEPIVDIYNNIEHDLLMKIASFFEIDEEVTVSNSLNWYFKKLQEMGALNQETIKIISKYSNVSKKQILKALNDAGYGSIDRARFNDITTQGYINISWEDLLKSESINSAINTSFTEISKTLKMINTKAIESTQQSYINVLNQAYLETSTGLYDYNTAIKRALEKMVDNGIKGASYKRKDGSIYSITLESAVRRDVTTAIYQSFNRGSEVISKELGAEYYEVSSHLGARLGDGIHPISNHFAWQGKVYKINGSDKEYGNFYDKTGYGDILGLGGVNCRHRFWAFFPDIDKPMQQQYDYAENKKEVELKNKQRTYERKLRKIKTNQNIAKDRGDSESFKKWSKKQKTVNEQYRKFIASNKLEHDYSRERIIPKTNESYFSISDIDIPDFNKEHIKSCVMEARDLLPEHIRKVCKDVKFKVDNNGYNRYSKKENAIYLNSNSNTYTVLHEIGHFLEFRLDLPNNEKYCNIIKNKFKNYSIKDYTLKKYDNGIGLFELKNNKNFVSDYQATLYPRVNGEYAFKAFGKVNVSNAKEYFSEGMKFYFKNPALLKDKDKELFYYIEKIMEDNND